MTKYYLYVRQPGGCDYTISCGQKLIPLNADNLVAARHSILSTLRSLGWGPEPHRDIFLEGALLLGVSYEEEIDLNDMLEAQRILDAGKEAEDQRAADLKMYLHLKEKLGM